jgi:type IV secretion system protein VirB9
MKRAAVTTVILLAITGHALALEHPNGAQNPDQRVCDVVYDPNDIVDVTAEVGAAITIAFRSSERIDYVSASDTAHLKQAETKGSNVLWLKATEAMPSQPLSVRTLQEDGTPRDYAIQWTAIRPPAREPARVALAASTEPAHLAGAALPQPPASGATQSCYVIRYQYPGDYKAAKDKAARAQWATWQQKKAEIALRQQQIQGTSHNVRYVAMGDTSIGPTEIFDDGYTTELHFPGNMRIPVILTVTPDGKESQVTGITAEDNGVVKLQSVLPMIRLRDGNLVLCIFNKGYNPIGHNPATGTTSPSIDRDVRAGK